MNLFLVAFVIGLCSCAPVGNKKAFREVEYEVSLERTPDQKNYFIKKDELPIYKQQFAKIRALGEEINCKITGNCAGSKRGLITKKSMFGDAIAGNDGPQFQEQTPTENIGEAGMGGEDVTASMMESQQQPNSFIQKDATSFGQQPQMDVKLSENEKAAASAGLGHFSNPMVGDPSSPQMVGGNDALMKLQEQQNAQTIDSSIQDKINFMDKANGVQSGPPMPAAPGVSDPLSQYPHADSKDDMPGGVTENDLLKAEDIQPNEMKGISSFLKDSNHVEKPSSDSMINDAPSEDGMFGKTNVDFGGQQAAIENDGNNGGEGPGQEQMAPNAPVSPGGPEVPTLNNIGLGMSPGELGPPGMPPSFKFVQDNTRQMIQQNSDYKVPQSALSNLWNSYMSSTQSLLGEKDPSANSRQAIWRPVGKKLHRRSNKELKRHR